MADSTWDRTVDILVVGSGAGSVCAALVAKDHGLDALIVEKQHAFGGTTAWSGGALWIPNNHLMARDGEADSIDDARRGLFGSRRRDCRLEVDTRGITDDLSAAFPPPITGAAGQVNGRSRP